VVKYADSRTRPDLRSPACRHSIVAIVAARAVVEASVRMSILEVDRRQADASAAGFGLREHIIGDRIPRDLLHRFNQDADGVQLRTVRQDCCGRHD
jgi:hypothetical protein